MALITANSNITKELTPKPVELTITPTDLHDSTVHQPLRTDDSRPVPFQERVNEVNEQVFSELLQDFNKNQTKGYFQSHPYDQIFTAQDLAADEWTLSNNYMRLIFGGKPNPYTDNIHLAYNHSIKQRAEAPVTKEDTLYIMNPLDFVESKNSNKDDLLDTFAKMRRYYKGQIDTDTERALKQRGTHRTTHTTFYGKGISQAGQATRFNYVTGQHGDLQFRPDTSNFYPYENLSSKTYAPMQDGKEVPLAYDILYGDDPRSVPIDHRPKIIPEPVSVFNFNDTGPYAGAEVDRYLQNYVQRDPPFASLFQNAGQRRWV